MFANDWGLSCKKIGLPQCFYKKLQIFNRKFDHIIPRKFEKSFFHNIPLFVAFKPRGNLLRFVQWFKSYILLKNPCQLFMNRL